jgi:hypothetical protein
MSGARTDSTASAVSRPAVGRSTRWVTETGEGHSQWYIERFRTMAADGVDLGGEARLIDALAAPGSRVLANDLDPMPRDVLSGL